MTYIRYPIHHGDGTTAGGDSRVVSPAMAVPVRYNGINRPKGVTKCGAPRARA